MATTYNFTESLSRIDDVLAAREPDKLASGIPAFESVDPSVVYMPQATVVHVNYEIVHDIWQPAEKKFDFFGMQSFVSEAICIGGSCSCCKDIMVTEKYLCFVYETSLKAELNESMDDAARFRTLAMVVSKKAKQKGYPMIKASIGMDYGEVSMIPINLHDNRFPRFIWKGDAAERAEQNAGKANDNIVISDIVWKNLSENNRKLFEGDNISFTTYRGKIVNIAMNNWIIK